MTSSKKPLREGMWKGDLEDLVQPLVSVDEYESKIDNSSIAVGFFVNDRDAADDLNRFIQKSAIPIIDSDVSPAPDQRGYYIVFAEMQHNDRFTQNFGDLLAEVGHLCAVENWKIKIRGVDDVIAFDAKRIAKVLTHNSVTDRVNAIKAKLKFIKERLAKK